MLSQRFGFKLASVLLLTISAAAMPGCFNDDADLKLAKAPAPKETLNEGQKVRVHDSLSNTDVNVTVGDLAAAMTDETNGGGCNRSVPTGPSGPGTGECGIFLNHTRSWDLCIARTYLALAKPQSSPLQVGRYSVQGATPQDRARFALAAVTQLQQAVATHLDPEIRSMLGMPISPWRTSLHACGPGNLTDPFQNNLVQSAAQIYVDVYHTVREAFDIATTEMVNVGDSGKFGLATVPGWGALRDSLGASSTVPTVPMTREGAARLLAGGINLPSITGIGQTRCSLPTLNPESKAALAVFRAAGPRPTDVLSADIDTLLNGTLSAGSVKDRLSDKFGFPLSTTVEQHYGIDTRAFVDAQEYLRDELNTFPRTARQMAMPTYAGGRVGALAPYAGTATEPQPADPAYYYAIARTPPNILFHQTGYDLNWDAPPFSAAGEFMPLADWIDAAIANAADYIAHSASIPDEKRNAAIAPFSVLVASGDRKGLVQVVRDQGIFAYGYSGTLKVVRGEDTMRCATTGNSEGAQCPSFVAGYSLTPIATRKVGLPDGGASVALTSVPADRMYLLRAVRNLASPRAGDYELLTGFDTHWVTTPSAEHYIGPDNFDYGLIADPSYNWFNSPVIPYVQQRVRELLAPSQKSCWRNKFTCVLTDVDERLPLENELSDDGDGVESSWKHYLNLARDAAALADNLAADYVSAGQANGQRTEEIELRHEEYKERARASLEELQNICGTDIDLKSLLGVLANQYTCNATGQCDFDIQAIASAPANQGNAAIQRIAKCLSSSTTDAVPLVSLGAKPLCLWTLGTNNYCNESPATCSATTPCSAGYSCLLNGTTGKCVLPCDPKDGAICGKAMKCVPSPSAPLGGTCVAYPGQCPAYKPDDMSCAEVFAGRLPPGATLEEATVPLGYFETPLDQLPSWTQHLASGTDLTRCDALAMSRQKEGGALGHVELIQADSFLDPLSIAALTERVAWEGRYGGFSAVLLDSVPRWETGSAFGTNPATLTAWPCGPDPSARPGSIFAKTWDCKDNAQRAQANDTLLKAFLGVKAISSNTSVVNVMLKAAPNDTSVLGNLHVNYLSAETLRFWYQSKPVARFSVPSPDWNVGGAIYVHRATCTGSGPDPCIAWTYAQGSPLLTSDQVSFSGLKLWGDVKAQSQLISRTRRYINPLLNLLSPATSDDKDPSLTFEVAMASKRSTGQWFHGSVGHSLLGPDSLTVGVQEALDGLELLCRVSSDTPEVNLSVPPVISTIADLPVASAYLRRLADVVRARAGLYVLSGMPARALDALRSSSATGAYPTYGGAIAGQIASIRQGLIALREYGLQSANEVQQLGYELSNLHDYLKQNVNESQLASIRFASTQASQLADCASKASSLISLGTVMSSGNIGATAISCANSIAQINFAEGIRRLEQENTELQSEVAIGNFGSQFASHVTNLQAYSLKLSQGFDEVEKGLAEFEQSSSNARRALSKALYLNGYEAQSEAEQTVAIGNLFDGKQMRYKRALDNAKRLAVLAKTAIEQRIGWNLDSMEDPLPLVDAPAKWQGDVCTFSGVDYSKISSSTGASNYAEGFIGDYVTKLQNVVESYRLAHSFHEGTDTAIVSLKNDLLNVRVPCEVAGPNLLYFASSLATAGPPGWERIGCVPTNDAEGNPVACVSAQELTDKPSRYLPSVPGYSLTFGGAAQGSAASLVQRPVLKPGRYRFSWYTSGADGGVGALAGKVVGTNITQSSIPGVVEDSSGYWSRRAIEFNVPTEQQVTVGFYNVSSQIFVAGPMLETLSGTESMPLTPFSDTTGSLNVQSPVCEDLTGEVFRGKPWTRDCVRLCPDGSNNCASAKSFCYHETKFDVSQRDIQLGRMGNFAGLARGNFNYRIENVALNFVGSSVRDCTNQTVATPCYSAGYVPYSLYHDGPFYIRNDVGADFKVEIFDGKIETARGLALERYLTNPVSETDRGLLQDYIRGEFQGRPLDGTFVLRIWDQDGVDFDAIQDVQILLKYRYWTRFN